MLHPISSLVQAAHHLLNQSIALSGGLRLRRRTSNTDGPRRIAHAIAYLEGSMPLQAMPDERVRSRQEAVALLHQLQG